MNEAHYKLLCERYGFWSGWAIWDYKNTNDTSVVERYRDELNTRHIMLALNMSGELPHDRPYWLNFRANTYSRRVKYACNDTILRGSYITDLFKGIEHPDSKAVSDILEERPELIDSNVAFFCQEMNDVGANDDTTYIVFGRKGREIATLFDTYFLPHLGEVDVIYYYHYAYRTLDDREWVEGFWDRLGIVDDYDTTWARYHPKATNPTKTKANRTKSRQTYFSL